MVKLIGKGITPLCFLPSGKLVCYTRGTILVSEDGIVLSKFFIPVGFKEKIFGRFRYTNRLLRLGIRTAIAINEHDVIFSIGNMLYEIDLRNGHISNGYYCGEGIRPLSFSEVKHINQFEDGIYFGGYLTNMDKKSVSIYKRVNVDEWQIIYTFPNGFINHVHNIVPDSFRNCIWIFTGDFDEASAVWKATTNFTKIERVVSNDQKYRGCVAFALPEGLLYATDSPYANDYIYLMNPKTYEVTKIASIDGSCIYGCQWKNNYVFSTTVEPDGRSNTNILEMLFGRKRGAGIKDENVHLYSGNLLDGFREIYKEKKDRLPYISFQFGVFRFPSGINTSNTLYFQPVATSKNDCCLVSIDCSL